MVALLQKVLEVADECAWKKRFREKYDILRRMIRQAIEEGERRGTISLRDLF